MAIGYHDTLYGFWEGHRMGTATLKENLFQQLTTMRDMFLHEVLLDLHKLYYSLERYRCLDILALYGMGPRTLWILRTYWGRLQMVAIAEVYYGPPLKSCRGMTQVISMSPTFFNVVVSTVIRHWVAVAALKNRSNR